MLCGCWSHTTCRSEASQSCLMQASQCNAHALRLVAPRHKQRTLTLLEAGTREALRRDLRARVDRRHHHIRQCAIKTAAVLAAIRSMR